MIIFIFAVAYGASIAATAAGASVYQAIANVYNLNFLDEMKPKNKFLIFLLGLLVPGSIVFLAFYFLIKNSLAVSVIGAILIGVFLGFYFMNLSNKSFKKSQSLKS